MGIPCSRIVDYSKVDSATRMNTFSTLTWTHTLKVEWVIQLHAFFVCTFSLLRIFGSQSLGDYMFCLTYKFSFYGPAAQWCLPVCFLFECAFNKYEQDRGETNCLKL